MLTKVIVRNFKGFKEELVFDLTQSNYSFNQDAVRSGNINTAIIYGHNGCGKSNLGLAIMDLVLHLTDKEKMWDKYAIYLNLDSDLKAASFEYHFIFNGMKVVYSCTKSDPQQLLTERLDIENETVMEYDFRNDIGFSKFDGTQTLRISSQDSRLSKLKFIRNNAILADNPTNEVFLKFMNFVDGMLLFYSLDGNRYQGLTMGTDSLDDQIVRSGNLKKFEQFLHRAEIEGQLESELVNGKYMIFFVFKNGRVPFSQIASTGTKSLELFYYWFISLSKASFVFIDEFDAFYHYELAELIVKRLREETHIQTILSTHNTDLMSNDILRPDCYYIMENNTIRSMNNATVKELRQAHNIQKMYKAGAFNE